MMDAFLNHWDYVLVVVLAVVVYRMLGAPLSNRV